MTDDKKTLKKQRPLKEKKYALMSTVVLFALFGIFQNCGMKMLPKNTETLSESSLTSALTAAALIGVPGTNYAFTGTTGGYAFSVKNNSSAPVVISNVASSFSNTDPVWSMANSCVGTLMPGLSCTIMIGYYNPSSLHVSAAITVTYVGGSTPLLLTASGG